MSVLNSELTSKQIQLERAIDTILIYEIKLIKVILELKDNKLLDGLPQLIDR
jgi:hypothetical protein